MPGRINGNEEDPSVIVGLACRVPGASNPSKLWDLITEQRDVQGTMPSDRYNVDNFYHPDGTRKGTVSKFTMNISSCSILATYTDRTDKRPVWLFP
jgi:hypothetical protein